VKWSGRPRYTRGCSTIEEGEENEEEEQQQQQQEWVGGGEEEKGEGGGEEEEEEEEEEEGKNKRRRRRRKVSESWNMYLNAVANSGMLQLSLQYDFYTAILKIKPILYVHITSVSAPFHNRKFLGAFQTYTFHLMAAISLKRSA